MMEENLIIPQTAFIATVVKAITNVKLHAKPFITYINGQAFEVDYNKRSIGTEYKFTYQKTFQEKAKKEKKEIRIGITFKNFFPTEDAVYPTHFTDKHLKMLLYFLEKKEDGFEFLATDFGRMCGLTKKQQNIDSAYNTLEDLLNIELRIIEKKDEINGENEFNNLLEVTNKRTRVSKINLEKTSKLSGVVIKETLSRANIKTIDLIDYADTGQMLVPPEFFKLKLDNNGNLGATSLAYNILYIASVNKEKGKNKYVYNVSTVLGWIGITEQEYKTFFENNPTRTHRYYMSKLEKLFQKLTDCGIKAKMKGVKVKNKNEFYSKEQVIVDITDFKKSIIKNND